ncbi:MAG: DUF4124 domain-containing protein [Gammaproteobacteria bacterium]|nr:DUF4124 domain-containing protein [Gammaproteobacteria bacterium]
MKARGTGLTPLVLGAMLTGLAPFPTAAGFKCWTNKEGVRECGNVIPPEYAQQEHRELSSTGVTLNKTSRAKTEEELRKEREEQARLAAIKAEEERIRREKEARDRVLLSTFTTEEDLLLARDGQLAAIDTRIMHTQQVLTQLEGSLEQLRAEAASLERSGKGLSDELLEKISAVQRQIESSATFIAERRRYKEELAAQFEADLLRYRELKGTTVSQ